MLKKWIILDIILLLVCSSIPSLAYSDERTYSSTSNGNWLYVGGNGPGNYSKIQDAINDSNDGDTVFVYDDSSPYYECLIINNSINLIGENTNTTVIDGRFKGIPVCISANDCTVSGFFIKNCPNDNTWFWKSSVISINGLENVKLTNNIILLNEYGNSEFIEGVLLNDSHHCSIQHNLFFDEEIRPMTSGIALNGSSTNNTIIENEITKYCMGIYFFPSGRNKHNTIIKNYIHDNLHGIDIWESDHNQITGNYLERNKYEAIRVEVSKYNEIIGNEIRNNGRGYHDDGGIVLAEPDCIYNHISGNNFYNNSKYGIILINTSDNIFENNNFMNHDKNVLFTYSFILFHRNSWQNNFWDKPRIFPYIFNGTAYILNTFPMTWYNIDWHPAQKPYDILGMM